MQDYLYDKVEKKYLNVIEICWQAYHILDTGTQPLGYSMGSLSPRLPCKFLNNCETNCRHNAASAKIKKTEFFVNLVLKNSFV